MKNYIGISRDHSISMRRVAIAAREDYNALIASFKENTIRTGIDTVMSVVECGTNVGRSVTGNRFDVVNSSISAVKSLQSYKTDGSSTPLFDSVVMLIDQLAAVPDAKDPDVSFLVMVVTDGEDNSSVRSAQELASRINTLIGTDRWTFTFRVPYGYKNALVSRGFPEYVIQEFGADNATEFTKSSASTVAATTSFYNDRSAGKKSKANFYADTSDMKTMDVKRSLTEITKLVRVLKIDGIAPKTWISNWFADTTKETYVLGSCYYQLTKTEKIQPQKKIIVWDKRNNRYYTGADARYLLNLPEGVETKVAPGSTPQFEVFVQSTSVNRHLVDRTNLLVYTG